MYFSRKKNLLKTYDEGCCGIRLSDILAHPNQRIESRQQSAVCVLTSSVLKKGLVGVAHVVFSQIHTLDCLCISRYAILLSVSVGAKESFPVILRWKGSSLHTGTWNEK